METSKINRKIVAVFMESPLYCGLDRGRSYMDCLIQNQLSLLNGKTEST
jgi:hypothetical protein